MFKSFLQTKDWAEFQKAFGRQVFWIDDKLVVKFDLPLGKSWLYCARTGITGTQEHQNIETKEFFKELDELAKKENSIFAKIEPNLVQNTNNQDTITKQIPNFNNQNSKLSSIVYRPSSNLQPQDELILDISHPEDKLLEQMHSKTRYNIRLAQKKDLKVTFSHDPKDIDEFYNLAVKTSAHDGFKYHSRLYYKKMIEILGKSKDIQVELITTNLEEKPIDQLTNQPFEHTHGRPVNHIPLASAIMLYSGDMCYYLHGASDWKNRQLMAPYFMQWEGICRAKKKGYKYYNFGGVSPVGQIPITNNQITNNPQIQNLNDQNPKKLPASPSQGGMPNAYNLDVKHPWSGITRFKMGFINQNSNQENYLHYPDAYDIVYQPALYWVYQLTKKIKKLT